MVEHGPDESSRVDRIDLDDERAVPPLQIAIGSHVRRTLVPCQLDRPAAPRDARMRLRRGPCDLRDRVRVRRQGESCRLHLQAQGVHAAAARRTVGTFAGTARFVAGRRLLIRSGGFAPTGVATGPSLCLDRARARTQVWTRMPGEGDHAAAAHRRVDADETGDQDANPRLTHHCFDYISRPWRSRRHAPIRDRWPMGRMTTTRPRTP